MMRAVCVVAAICCVVCSFHTTFITTSSPSNGVLRAEQSGPKVRILPAEMEQGRKTGEGMDMSVASSSWSGATRLLAGACLGLAMFVASSSSANAAVVEDVAIPADSKGNTTTLSKDQLGRGKRLFNAACSTCHVSGGTRTNQNVGLDLESLQGARPRRDNVEGLVDYLNTPTTYDGLTDISDVHPSMKSAKSWPKMRFMKQQDLVDISSYIMYETQVITEKWGGGKIYY